MPVKEDKIFQGRDEEVHARISTVVLLRGQPLPADLIQKLVTTAKFKKDERALGLTLRHGMVTKMNFDSPLKGTISIGDIIMFINGTLVTFEDKAKENEKNDFNIIIKEIFARKGEQKIEIGFLRLRSRILQIPKALEAIPKPDGHVLEMAVLYQFKYLKLGLNIQQAAEKIIVNYTAPESSSGICFNIGEEILAVESTAVANLKDVRQLILNFCNKIGYARVLVNYPTTDVLKNAVRNMLMSATKESERPSYVICTDVKKYAEEGIAILESCKEPEIIWYEDRSKVPRRKAEAERTQDGKQLERSAESVFKKEQKTDAKSVDPKKPKKNNMNFKKILSPFKLSRETTGGLSFRDKAGETDVPSEWNSKLFVVLPPLKSVETEKNGTNQNSVYGKK